MATEKAVDRYCDIVLKGGITSGIVYPLAISKLSKEYRFRSIGGTSAGAVAAAAAAAAEYQRRRSASTDGFRALDLLPNQLSVEDEQGRSKLFLLFRPQPGTRPLFRMLIAALGKRSVLSRVAHALARGAIEFWPECALGTLLLGVASWWAIRAGLPESSGEIGWTLLAPVAVLAFIGGLVGLLAGAYRCVTREVVANGFGFCKGIHGARADSTEEELTPWLHSLINGCAGRGGNDPPLTFGDLWEAPGAPPPLAGQTNVRGIELQMMTTNVTHGRPYLLPFDDSAARVFFKPAELREYFPDPIVQWMEDHAGRYAPVDKSDPPSLPHGLLQMPDPGNLPIVVATRLSLSYPFLISAVPLWAIDYEAPPQKRAFARCWFSDGGLSSNFPIHLFDGLLPRWPTFGMKLEDFPKGYAEEKDRIYMPLSNFEGFGDAWDRFDEGKNGLARIKGFAASLIDSAMNWNDNVLSRLPGNRDRIVRIRLRESEGGMNLNMGHEKIKQLSNAGDLAATNILDRFVFELPPLPQGNPMGWENHRWIRLRLLMALFEQSMPKVQNAWKTALPGTPPYEAQVRGAQARNVAQYPLGTPDQVQAMLDALARVSDLADVVKNSDTTPTAPRPLPELKIRSRL